MKYSSKYKEKIVKLYTRGFSSTYLKDRYGGDHSTILEWVKKAGYQLRNRETLAKIQKKINQAIIEGRSKEDIADELNFDIKAIDTWTKHVGSRKYTLDDTFFEKIDAEEKAYWLGFIFADGNVNKTLDALTIALKGSDVGHLLKYLRDLKADYPIYETLNKYPYKGKVRERPECRVAIGSRKVVFDLTKLGVVPNKSFIAIPPKIKVDLERHFWRGVFDGDGSFSKDLCTMGLYGSKGVTDSFCKFLKKHIGNDYRVREQSNKNIQVWIRGGKRSKLKILDKLYRNSTVYLDRKYKRYLEVLKVNHIT